MEASSKSNLKKVTLELGGKSPHLVFESANLAAAAEAATGAIFFNMGQDCCAGSRLYVQSSIYDRFIQELCKSAEEWSSGWGDPFKESTKGGPLISKVQMEKVKAYVASGKEEGGKVVFGDEPWPGKGWYYRPTKSAAEVIADVKPEMKVVREEIFGPVLVVGRFDTEEEAIALANDTTYGLGAGLHSTDASQCMRVANKLEAGTVWVNQYGILPNNSPFGGYKQSGIGRELGSYALAEYTNVKAIHWDFGN
jgi:aldehyde dehydrogenase (NAD+)